MLLRDDPIISNGIADPLELTLFHREVFGGGPFERKAPGVEASRSVAHQASLHMLALDYSLCLPLLHL